MKLNTYAIGAILWTLAGSIVLIFSDNLEASLVFIVLGSVWQLTGFVVSDLKEKK